MEFLKQIAQGRERKLDGPAKKVGRRRVHVCTVYLPASLSASGSQGAAMQNPGSSQSCARPIFSLSLSFLATAEPDTSFIQPVAKLQTRNFLLLDEKLE
jgi:hypothetical protein